MLIEMTLGEVAWCAQGHPVLLLNEACGPREVAVALSVEDAQALAPHPERYNSGRARCCDTLLDALLRSGARLTGIELAIGPRGVLQAHLQGIGGHGTFSVPAHASDGFILSCRHHLPLWITAETLLRVGTTHDHADTHHAPRPAPPPDPLAPFRSALDGIVWPEASDEGTLDNGR